MANPGPSGSRRTPDVELPGEASPGEQLPPRDRYADVEQDAGVPVPNSDPPGEDRERHPGATYRGDT